MVNFGIMKMWPRFQQLLCLLNSRACLWLSRKKAIKLKSKKMATITGASINIVSDSKAKTAKVTVKCNVKFTPVELCQMKSCGGRWFKLKCQLWGADSGLNFGDDPLFTFPSVLFFQILLRLPMKVAHLKRSSARAFLMRIWAPMRCVPNLLLQT